MQTCFHHDANVEIVVCSARAMAAKKHNFPSTVHLGSLLLLQSCQDVLFLTPVPISHSEEKDRIRCHPQLAKQCILC